MSLRNLHKNQFASKKKQQGFLLPLAVFIVVVMGLFALVLSRNTIQTNTSSVQEAVSVQAFYAAESGAQRGMQHLFYLAAPTTLVRQQVDQRCINIATNTPLVIAFKSPENPGLPDVPGLNNCSISVSCTCRFSDNSDCSPITAANYNSSAIAERLTSFYQITSVATCGITNLRSVRTIEVGSFLKQE